MTREGNEENSACKKDYQKRAKRSFGDNKKSDEITSMFIGSYQPFCNILVNFVY